jgi:hypothetical protein
MIALIVQPQPEEVRSDRAGLLMRKQILSRAVAETAAAD